MGETKWSLRVNQFFFLFFLADASLFAFQSLFFSVSSLILKGRGGVTVTRLFLSLTLDKERSSSSQYLTQFANQRLEQQGTGGIPYFHKELQKAASNHIVSLRTSSFDAHSEISDIPMTYYQTGVYALAKENGWSSYQELLDVISNYYSREFWEKKVIELEIYGDWYNFEEKYKNYPERKLNAFKKRVEGHINREEVDKLKSRPPPLVRQLLNMQNQEIDREVVEKIFEFASKPKALFE